MLKLLRVSTDQKSFLSNCMKSRLLPNCFLFLTFVLVDIPSGCLGLPYSLCLLYSVSIILVQLSSSFCIVLLHLALAFCIYEQQPQESLQCLNPVMPFPCLKAFSSSLVLIAFQGVLLWLIFKAHKFSKFSSHYYSTYIQCSQPTTLWYSQSVPLCKLFHC